MDVTNQLAGIDDVSERVERIEIVAHSADVATVRNSSGMEGYMPVNEFYVGRRFEVGEPCFAVRVSDGSRPTYSVVRPELVEAVMAGIVPEIRTGVLRVMGVARLAGVRTKVAVASTVEGIDPIGACVGRERNRVLAMSRMLGGERVDIVAWHPDSAVFLRNALAPAAIDDVVIDGRDAVVYAPAHLMSAAVGAGGLNSQLAGQLAGFRVAVASR